MIVILKHIPANTKKQNIIDFLEPEVKGGLLRRKGHLVSISIVSQRNIQTREVQHHALIEIQPDVVAVRVIKKLNGNIILDKHVAVVEYKIRNWHNDRRIINNYLPKKQRLHERRTQDRRGQYEVLTSEESDINISGKKAFHMKGW